MSADSGRVSFARPVAVGAEAGYVRAVGCPVREQPVRAAGGEGDGERRADHAAAVDESAADRADLGDGIEAAGRHASERAEPREVQADPVLRQRAGAVGVAGEVERDADLRVHAAAGGHGRGVGQRQVQVAGEGAEVERHGGRLGGGEGDRQVDPPVVGLRRRGEGGGDVDRRRGGRQELGQPRGQRGGEAVEGRISPGGGEVIGRAPAEVEVLADLRRLDRAAPVGDGVAVGVGGGSVGVEQVGDGEADVGDGGAVAEQRVAGQGRNGLADAADDG